MKSVVPPECRAAIIAEYDRGGISQKELAAKHGLKESTLNNWFQRRPPKERKCTCCGSGVPTKAIRWRGSLLCGSCSKAKRTAAHLIYYHEHREKIDAAPRKQNLFSEAKHRDALAEKWFRNSEVLNRLRARLTRKLYAWEECTVRTEIEMRNPEFVFVLRGKKQRENLLSPLPKW